MSQDTLFILSLSVAFPAIAGLIRLRKIEKIYYTFLIYIFVSLLNELVVGLAVDHLNREARTLNWNLFNLFEATVFILQFYYWKVFEKYKKGFIVLMVLVLIGWLVENFIVSTIYKFNPVFLIVYSFVLVLLSVQTINHIIVHQNRTILTRNAMFIICIATVIFFTYNIFVFTLQAKGIVKTNKELMTRVFEIRVYINAFTNLLFGLAVCFMPEKISRKNLFSDAGQKD